MTVSRGTDNGEAETIARMPAWVSATRADTHDDTVFRAGAALSHVHHVLAQPSVPMPLLRARLALGAAQASLTISGRPTGAGALRDAALLTREGDLPGPAGEVYQSWRQAAARPPTAEGLARALPQFDTAQIAHWLGMGGGAPLHRAALVLEAVMAEAPRAEPTALIMADAALARGLGWRPLVPFLALGLTSADMRKTGADLRLACHRAVIPSAQQACREAADLARRAAHLNAVAPKLRAKAAAQAVAMFLSHEAVAPSALPLPDRAARRLCDRLVDLGAVRELTGRDTFRLYGV